MSKNKTAKVDKMELEKENEEMVKDYINSDDFAKTIENAVPERVKIISEFTPEMKDIKGDFVGFMLGGPKAAGDDDAKETAKELRKIFKKVSDYCSFKGGWPNEDTESKLEKLAENVAIAVKFLDFAKINDFRECLANHGIYLDNKKTTTLKDDYPNINEDAWESYKSILDDAVSCQNKICGSIDSIQKKVFEEEVPEEVQFSKENRCGLKKGAFNKLVSAKAMAQLKKTEEKARKYMTTLAENSVFTVAREEILKESFENMLNE